MVRWRFWSRVPNTRKGDQKEARRLYNLKDYDSAEPYLLKLIAQDPGNEWTLDVFTRLLMNTNRHRDAIPILEKLIDFSVDRDVYEFRLARCFAKLLEYGRVISILERMARASTIPGDGWDLLESAVRNYHDSENADYFWEKLAETGTSSPQIDVQMIRIGLQKTNLEDVAKRIEKVTDINTELPLSDKWRLKLAEVLIQEGAADIAFEIITSVPPETPNYNRFLIKVKQALGDDEDAISIARESLESSPEHGVMFAAIRLSWDLGLMEDVINFTNKILQDKPTQRLAHRFRLRAEVKIGDTNRIRSAIKNSLELLPDFVDAHRVMIDLAFSELNDWDLVVHHCNEILKIDSTDRRARCHLIHSLLNLNLFDDVSNQLEETTNIHPEDDEVDLTAAQAHWKMNDGMHIECINKMLKRHKLEPIYSAANNQNISVENLRCNAPKSESQNQPLVSIIMTVYGRDEYLDVAIDSILNQTYSNIELIVVDDRSPDDAFAYLQKRALEDSRLVAMQVEKNGGTYCAKNSAISIANGDYIGFMDSDDWTHPQRIEKQVEALMENGYRAICHSYFRVNEIGDIIYKGMGAIRLACISLLARREVFEYLGHFDSMRVGADTEFIERIKAYFGDDALLHDPIPSMFMLNHSSSLTGGGRFQISWRSISGPRLKHHSAFKTWHKRIRYRGWSPHVAHPLRVRPYEIPAEMTSGDIHWRQETPLFSQRIRERNKRWWSSEVSAPWQGQLSEKSAGILWAKQQGIRVPKTLWEGTEISDIPKLSELPKRIVIKPTKGYSAKNVLCLVDGVNILDNRSWNDSQIFEQFTSDKFLERVQPKWIVEELLRPEIGREDEKIPRDWKFYCFGEEIALIHVVLRNSTVDKSMNIHHYFTPDLRQLKRQICTTRDVPKEPLFFPECWDEMVTKVKTLGKKLGCFMRIDMYATESGAVFGEFTPTPEGGEGFTDWADKYLATFWKGVEGVEH